MIVECPIPKECNEYHERWVAELLSGRFTQGRGWLRPNVVDLTARCCMGVGCELLPGGEWDLVVTEDSAIEREEWVYTDSSGEDGARLPTTEFKRAVFGNYGEWENAPINVMQRRWQAGDEILDCLAHLNDRIECGEHLFTFEHIAAAIRDLTTPERLTIQEWKDKNGIKGGV